MENIGTKRDFLRFRYVVALQQLDINAPAQWGKMNVMQMIEHMSDYVRIANGRTALNLVTPEDVLPKMVAFLESEKPFKENTPNSLMSDTPPAVKSDSKATALIELQGEINHLFDVFNAHPDQKIMNPFFGPLSFDQQVQLLYKHSTHHLRQFGSTAN